MFKEGRAAPGDVRGLRLRPGLGGLREGLGFALQTLQMADQ